MVGSYNLCDRGHRNRSTVASSIASMTNATTLMPLHMASVLALCGSLLGVTQNLVPSKPWTSSMNLVRTMVLHSRKQMSTTVSLAVPRDVYRLTVVIPLPLVVRDIPLSRLRLMCARTYGVSMLLPKPTTTRTVAEQCSPSACTQTQLNTIFSRNVQKNRNRPTRNSLNVRLDSRTVAPLLHP